MDTEEITILSLLTLFFTGVAAFIRHVWWIITICMTGAPVTGGQVVLAVIGLLIPPLGALHGVWLWFH